VWDLLALLETLQDKDAICKRFQHMPESDLTLSGEYEESDHIKFDNVSIVTPDGVVLVEGGISSLVFYLF